MQYVVDESVMDFNGVSAEFCCELIESVLDVIDDIMLAGDACCYSEELFCRHVYGEMTIWELFADDSPVQLLPEIQARLAVAFNRLQTWEMMDGELVEVVDPRIDGILHVGARSVAWVHSKMLQDRRSPIACIVGSGRDPAGCKKVVVGQDSIDMWFIGDARDDELMFRWIVEELTDCPAGLETFSARAFRNLDFVSGSFNGIKGMSKSYVCLIPTLVKHLAALSDEGRIVFVGPWEEAEAKFGAFGVNLSDENGATKNNRVARRERLKEWDGSERIFWWHTKLERHQDRIHFCPRGIAKGEKILIGIFCLHLTT
ncbi:hypothetical protein [Pseudomonas alabamensis]|uniref:hypothetical protein n=1 Tax=Pseudomonas alabamensis TaxID=3064349 RepID=UPI000A93B282